MFLYPELTIHSGGGEDIFELSDNGHLQQDQIETGNGVAYLYFGYQDRARQQPIDVFSIVVKQYLEQLPDIPSDIEKLYDGKPSEKLGITQLKDIMLSVPKRCNEQGGQVSYFSYQSASPSRHSGVHCHRDPDRHHPDFKRSLAQC